MTRINTNVSSLTAQKSLARANVSLQQALTRLSTGLRINVGKDDPAGLIASEMLRSDIVSVERAITNSQRANQVIATADSALGQVSSLLNDIRGLVTEAANEGAMSEDQIAANQLQIDASLEALNRIAQTTSFQGRKLLDGSLDFQTTPGTNFSDITDMQISQANLGASDSMSVDIRVNTAAETAEVKMTGSTYTAAEATLTLGMGVDYTNSAAGGAATTMTIYAAADSEIDSIKFIDLGGAGATSVDLNVGGNQIEVTIATAGDTVAAVATAIQTASTNGSWGVTVSEDAGGGNFIPTVGNDDGTHSFVANELKIEATTDGPAYNNMAISFTTHAGGAAVDPVWTDLDDRSTLVISLQTGTAHTMTAIKNAIDTYDPGTGTFLLATPTVTGKPAQGAAAARHEVDPANAADTGATATTGTTGGGVLTGDLVVQMTGKTGSEFLTFDTGTQMEHIASAINAISDTLSMTATVADGTGADAEGTLVFSSSDYGSSALVDIDVVSDGGVFEDNLEVDGSAGTRDTGTDIDATVNGSATLGDGNTLTLSTAMLGLEATIAAGVEKTISFTIDSGGALFQLGPDVVASQQARLGIQSVNAAQLRGDTGRLYELGSGQSAALTSDTTRAAKIVDEVITKVSSLRGRLGALQKTTLDTNIKSLNDTLENLVGAESQIRDADFAAEAAALTRAQILVQSGVSVLAIANSNPQNVLALLR